MSKFVISILFICNNNGIYCISIIFNIIMFTCCTHYLHINYIDIYYVYSIKITVYNFDNVTNKNILIDGNRNI